MKKFLIAAVAAVCGLNVHAQIVSSRSAMTTREVIEEPVVNNGWSTFGVEYLPSSFSFKHGDSESFSGVAVNYTKASALTASTPLFLEWGVGAQYSFWSEDETSINYVSLKVPVNLVYDFKIPETNICIDPYVGLRLRGNVWGEVSDDDEDESYNLFDKDEGDWKRLQIGWQIGVKARFNNSFYVGLGYGTDFSKMADEMHINEASISLGLVF